MKPFLFIVIVLLLPFGISAQTISGYVRNQLQEPLVGAGVYWLGTTEGVFADANGKFSISTNGITSRKLIATYTGYLPDTIELGEQNSIQFVLRINKTLKEVVIQGQQDGVVISDSEPIKTERITQTELGKAACCDLAGCFETQTTVQPQTTNVLTNARELRILGMSGVYNQVLIDGFPLIQGLTYTYGISTIPGPLVDNIYVSKGANSVLQGFESICGQINVETKEPDEAERLFVNAYINSFWEKHLNVIGTIKKEKWSNLSALHVVRPSARIDRDQDDFLDLPLLTRYLFSNKWKYGNEKETGWHSRVGLRLMHEQRVGGQMQYNPKTDQGSSTVYGQTVRINQPEIWTKTGYTFNNKQRIVVFASAYAQHQQSYFGTVHYRAKQTGLYNNWQYEHAYASHEVKTGISYRHLTLHEDIQFTDTFITRNYAGHYTRQENIPGVFVENTMRFFNDKLTWIAGLRADHHNQHGMQYTPRTLLKYDIRPKTIVRANFGLGWRTVNLFSENIGLMISSRDIVFAEPLQPEKAINAGINLTHKFESSNDVVSGYLSMDYYRTDFQNQIFPDYDTDPTRAIIKNFKGTSISNGLQIELFTQWYKRFDVKVGYNYLDVYRMVQGVKQLLPFNPMHKLLGSLSYKPVKGPYHIDCNIHGYGKQRLPNTQSNPIEFRRPDFSKPYVLVNAQFTYALEQFEVYAGCENIFDFRQRQPIISWQNPFSDYFDTSSVWGPTRGREIYLGVRFKKL